jgi:hypothetical protein
MATLVIGVGAGLLVVVVLWRSTRGPRPDLGMSSARAALERRRPDEAADDAEPLDARMRAMHSS